MDVLDWRQDAQRGDRDFVRSLWDAAVGGTENILKNPFASRVELSGQVDPQSISPFQAFIASLRNGFIRAFNARHESTSDLE